MDRVQADELGYLQWFYYNCDFGPAHEDVISIMNEEFMEETGQALPKGYGYDD